MTENYKNRITGYELVPADQLQAHPLNARRHPAKQREALRGSLDTLGWIAPVIINTRTGYCIDGHARIEEALTQDDGQLLPVVYVDLSEAEEAQALASYDFITTLADYDSDVLDNLLRQVQTDDERVMASLSELAEFNGLYFGEDGFVGDLLEHDQVEARATLAERFVVPPFSVLDARQGYWQDRKRAWLAIGIQSELGRGENLTEETTLGAIAGNQATGVSPDYKKRINGKLPAAIGGQPLPLDRMSNGKSPARKSAQDLMRGEHVVGYSNTAKYNANLPEDVQRSLGVYAAIGGNTLERGQGSQTGTSIFDPVLCELAYSWFTPIEAHILDPFAGGSVRGIVASHLGRKYTGVDLRAEQNEANKIQGAELVPDNMPTWITGDSATIDSLAPNEYDFVFTCPPYADLEIYSDNPADISNMPYDEFLAIYRTIINKSCAMLKDNRFACVVVGDVRDKKGNYYNFVSDTIQAFIDAGLSLYNEAILVTAVGSLPIRAGKQFSAGRKLGKTHQNVLVFLKGDAKQATAYCGDVDVWIPDEDTDTEYGEILHVS